MTDKVLFSHLHNALQNYFGEIEESWRSLCKASLQFPLHTESMIEELKALKHRVEYMITTLETLDREFGEANATKSD